MYQYRQLSKQEQRALVEERLRKNFPRHSPPHPIHDAPYYLITAACYEHRHRLNTSQRRQELLRQLLETFQQKNINVIAWVVLSNHYHLLTETVNFTWLSQALRRIHGRSAHKWNREDNRTGKFWCSYSDRAIRDEKHFYTALNYIHYNPVKHQLVRSSYDWKETSIHQFLQNYGRDWLRSCWREYTPRDYGNTWDNSPVVGL
jgi:putative transposase